ncbi:NAD(P)-binding protein [Westerdykella ornata]|uniref:NAD(P)-binding protein n=1 Tax=Westerdykella ornata TaxID=318751 RepID=A0A6A6JJ22_WESOR|nr:NAD(P)-binding protein [Westerdykella ornata]KAF2276457.1 NAD(P)-binding protein [Westerdykella ornata]
MANKSVLVTGASGLLGREILRTFHYDLWKAVGTGLNRINPPEIIKLDIQDSNEIARCLDQVKPHAIVHCAANRFPDSCEANPEAARKLNVEASRALAEAAIDRNIFLIYISTDYVFPGRPGDAPYKVTDATRPPNIYGQTKLDGEKAVLDVARKHGVKNKIVVLRVPVLYGKCDEPSESAVNVLLSQLWASQEIKDGDRKIKVDNWALRYPTNTADVGRVCRDICKLYLDEASSERRLPEILQFSSEDKMTKWEIVKTFSEIMGLPLDGMEPTKPNENPADGVQRPYDCHLDTTALRDLGLNVSTTDFLAWWRREIRAFRH